MDTPILKSIEGYNPEQKSDKLVFIYTRPSFNGKVDAERDVFCITSNDLYDILDKHPDRRYFKPVGVYD